MNTYITLGCLLAVVAFCQGSALGHGYSLGYGYGLAAPVISAPIYAPAAVSSANLVKAAPIPVIKSAIAPVYTAPIIRSVAIAPAVSYGWGYGLGAYGHGGYGLGAYGLGGYGLGAYGLGGYGLGYGLGGYGLGWGYGKH